MPSAMGGGLLDGIRLTPVSEAWAAAIEGRGAELPAQRLRESRCDIDRVPPFRVRALTLHEVRALYARRMVEDFPPDELKPLSMIERALARGEYACLGAADGDDVLAYAFFVKAGAQALFDYFAVRKGLRDAGVGSRFIRALIGGALAGLDCVLLEVDDPDRAPDADERTIRDRRLAFYLRNGLMDTGVTAEVYGVAYRILALPLGRAVTPDEARRVYAALYHSILPKRVYDERVFIAPGDARAANTEEGTRP